MHSVHRRVLLDHGPKAPLDCSGSDSSCSNVIWIWTFVNFTLRGEEKEKIKKKKEEVLFM